MNDAGGLGLLFGLASALTWGTADFSGGIATRRNSVYTVIIISQLVGLACLLLIASFTGFSIPFTWRQTFWGGIAGVSGALGLVALYRGLAYGRMSVVAPVSALITALFPILFGLFLEGLPRPLTLFGFGISLPAIWLVSGSGSERVAPGELLLPVSAGLGFAGFFIFIDRVADEAVLWPLIAARLASTSALAIYVISNRNARFQFLPVRTLPPIFLAGIFDIGGNAFFILATRYGRLDIASVLAAFYPAATVVLARVLLSENISIRQWVGIFIAVLALGLLAI